MTPPVTIRTATPASVRAVNRAIVLRLIRHRQPISRAELARLTGIFRSSISEIVDDLLTENMILEAPGSSRRGRIPVSLTINDDYLRVLGFTIRPEYSQIGVAGLGGVVQHIVSFETPRDPDHLLEQFARAVNHLEFALDDRAFRGYRRVGVSAPGFVDVAAGRILWTPTRPELSDFPIAARIRERTGLSVMVDNDCNAGALSEIWFGERSGAQPDFVFVNVGDSDVGASVVIGGEPYRGHNAQFAAEFGHMIVDASGPECACGRRGCWQQFVSNAATWASLRRNEPFSPAGFNQILSSAVEGEGSERDAIRRTAHWLALGISNIAFAMNPAEVVVSGRITMAWDLVQAELARAFRSPRMTVLSRPARLPGEESLLHGAVCLALRQVFAPPRFG